MDPEEPTTLGGMVRSVLGVPIARAHRAVRDAADKRGPVFGLAIAVAWIPAILGYEAFAVPLVLGSVVLGMVVVAPAIAIVALARLLEVVRAARSNEARETRPVTRSSPVASVLPGESARVTNASG